MSRSHRIAIAARDAECRTGTTYPEPFGKEVQARAKTVLGDLFGLTNHGVNRVDLPPGAGSSQRHRHTREDECLYVISGDVTLVTDQGEERLRPGTIAGFKAGTQNGHHLVNSGESTASPTNLPEAFPRGGVDKSNQNSYSVFMVRTRTFDPETALSKAVELFSSKGYSETSMDDLVRATGVSRYGIYGTFGNKRELFEEALEKYADSMGRQSYLRLLEPDASLRHVRKIFDERIEAMCESGENKGCMICHTAMELAPHDQEIKGVLQKFLKRMSKAFSIGLETAKAKGEVKKDLDVAAAGEYLTGAIFGLAVLARAGFPRETLDSFVDNTMASLTG